MRTHLISAICTPLQDDDSLHVDGLAAHLDNQWRHGIAGVLVAGSMGLCSCSTTRYTAIWSAMPCNSAHGRGEVLVGVGDASYNARFMHRVRRAVRHRRRRCAGAVLLSLRARPILIEYFQGPWPTSRCRPLVLWRTCPCEPRRNWNWRRCFSCQNIQISAASSAPTNGPRCGG